MEIAAVSKPMGSVTTPTAALNNFPSFIYSFPSAPSLGDSIIKSQVVPVEVYVFDKFQHAQSGSIGGGTTPNQGDS